MEMDTLKDAIRDSLSPQACALIIAHLQTVAEQVPAASEVRWFVDELTELCGGSDAVNALYDELGI